jgi:hypothetical protein
MRPSSDDVILELDSALRSPRLIRHILETLHRTTEGLRGSDEPMAWETIPLDLFDALPSSIRSCWIFLLRASRETGAERHPNSHQRSLSLVGSGQILIRERGRWHGHSLTSDPAVPVDSRWATIPPNTWHSWLVGPQDWGVLSFHTVPADQLIEERPTGSDDLDHGPTEPRLYRNRA